VCILTFPRESSFRFEGVVVGEIAVAVASERRTARPQAAGTCRYHLPFNVADET
jgi:hypothetical protein